MQEKKFSQHKKKTPTSYLAKGTKGGEEKRSKNVPPKTKAAAVVSPQTFTGKGKEHVPI